MTLTRLDGFTLEPPHPMAGLDAFQCPDCDGISYPPHQDPKGACPHCEEDDE